MRTTTLTMILGLAASAAAHADNPASWTEPQKPFRLYGNAYYVGTHGLASVLITSDKGHILIDGTMPEGASIIAANIRALGFKVEDVKLILNTHAHFDHAGGIAELQKLSGAKVAASAESAQTFATGKIGPDDPQFGSMSTPIAPVAKVQVFKDGETLHVGSLAVTAHITPGHTAGGTSWTWQSCEQKRCLSMIYADSISAVSAPDYKFSAHPERMQLFEKSYTVLTSLPCDLLITPHPEASSLFERLAKREQDHDPSGLVDTNACKMYVETMRTMLRKRVASETGKAP